MKIKALTLSILFVASQVFAVGAIRIAGEGGWTNMADVSNGRLGSTSVPVNENGNPLSVDLSTRAIMQIGYEHHEIHAGSHYTVTHWDTDLDTGETNGIIIIVPDSAKWPHMLLFADTSVAANGYVVEGPTVGATGAQIVAYNNDRNSTNAATTLFYETIGSNIVGGTVIDKQLFGAASVGNFRGSGGAGGRENEVILKRNTTYAVYMVGAADNGRINYHFSFYEHTNKTD